MISSAPAKIILFGEHAVVYGEPCISMAVNLRTTLSIKRSVQKESCVNGNPVSAQPHMKKALEMLWKGESLDIETSSDIPPASGLGSSAALVVATIAALMKMCSEEISEEKIAKRGFDVEYAVQGSASPNDTSICTHGSAIMLAKEKKEGFLWEIEKDGRKWFINHCDFPEFDIVVGHTGIRGGTAEQVRKVRGFVEMHGMDIIKDIGEVAEEGAKSLARGDLRKAGKLMTKNHRLLDMLGVNTPQIQRLVDASLPSSYGAKLTGAGGGGCMIALTENPEETAKAIESAGGKAYRVRVERRGVLVE